METIQWEHYPYVAENSHARTWLEMQVKLCLAYNTIQTFGDIASFLPFQFSCAHREWIAIFSRASREKRNA